MKTENLVHTVIILLFLTAFAIIMSPVWMPLWAAIQRGRF